MRKYQWTFIVVLIAWMISFIGCDEMDEMVEPVLTETPIEQPVLTATETSVEQDDTSVMFPDANLASKVRGALNLSAGAAISEAQIATLIVLDASVSPDAAQQEKISDLTGLEHATQLTTLYLNYNQISDVSPLTGLTQLIELSLSDNEISNLAPLAGLTQLTGLALDDNKISNISPLSRLKQLTTLGLRNNQIRDINPLSRLKQLTTLDLYVNKISNVRPLSELVNLDFLFLGGNPITDKSPLLTLLEKNPDVEIDIGETIWMPDSNLRDAVREELRLASNVPITRRSMQRLTQLYAGEGLGPLPLHSQIKNLTGLERATQLERLNLNGNHIKDVSPLAGLTQLNELNLGGNQIGDIGPLAGLTQLEQLYLQRNQIQDVNPLAKLTQLEGLYLFINQIRDVSPLVDLTQLEVLRLSGNPIQDVAPLRVLVDKIFDELPPDSFLDIQIYLPN